MPRLVLSGVLLHDNLIHHKNICVEYYDSAFPPSVCSDNILVLDIFFEALNYETIEQKKAYELAGLLGKKMTVECFGGRR